MNYEPVTTRNQTNGDTGIETNVNAWQAKQEKASDHEYILLPLMLSNSPLSLKGYANNTNRVSTVNPSVSATGQGLDNANDQERTDSSTQDVNIAGASINTISESINTSSSNINTASPIPNDPSMQSLEATGIFDNVYDDREEVGAEVELNNLETTMNVNSIPTKRIHKDHPIEQIIRDLHSAPLTRRTSQQNLKELGLILRSNQSELTKIFNKWYQSHGALDLGHYKWTSDIKKRSVIMRKDMVVRKGNLIVKMFNDLHVPHEVKVFTTFPDKVYNVEKVLYGLHQAPRAWYETLSTYLLENGYRRGTIDKTLFIKKDRGDILLVQVYVDDIIIGSTKKSLCVEFEQMMHKRFQMSSMGELTFFLRLKVQQKEDGIFISQDKYVAGILKKFDFTTVKAASTPIETNKALNKDEEAEDVDVHLYRLMIGSLMYLTASRPDIMFVVYACARDSSFDLEAFSDSDYAGASLDRKSIIG
ncbi:putative ribonuclease H-like domain-containing protein, partial [Tanacetum coccineum]